MTIRFPTVIAAAFGLALAVMSAHAGATGTAEPGAETSPGLKRTAPVWYGAPAKKPVNGQPGAEMAPDVVPVDAPADRKAAGKKDQAKEKAAGDSANAKKAAKKKAAPKKTTRKKIVRKKVGKKKASTRTKLRRKARTCRRKVIRVRARGSRRLMRKVVVVCRPRVSRASISRRSARKRRY